LKYKALFIGTMAFAYLCVFAVLIGGLTGHLQYMVIAGSSMEPQLKEGDKVLLMSYKAFKMLSGDLGGRVVVYDAGGELICHRVIWYNDTHFLAKGDFNPHLDFFPPKPVEGTVVAVVVLQDPWASWFLLFIMETLFLATGSVVSVVWLARMKELDQRAQASRPGFQ
jgi:hypothetical protein